MLATRVGLRTIFLASKDVIKYRDRGRGPLVTPLIRRMNRFTVGVLIKLSKNDVTRTDTRLTGISGFALPNAFDSRYARKPIGKTMNVVKSDDRLVLKSSTREQLKHSCVEYCVEKRKQFSNAECLAVITSMLIAAYSYSVSGTDTRLKIGLVTVLFFTLALRFSFKVRNESLLITAPIGLQLTTTYVTGRQRVFSLPWHNITDVLIVDVIHTQKVLYYLAIKTSQNGLVILFQKSTPRLHFLEIIYKDVYRLLENNR